MWGFLIVATSLEATGDAVVRMGLAQSAWLSRSLLFAAGAVLLFGYGLSVNLAPTGASAPVSRAIDVSSRPPFARILRPWLMSEMPRNLLQNSVTHARGG